MSTTTLIAERSSSLSRHMTWLPLLILPVLALSFGNSLPGWQAMWLLALSVYAGLKWLSYADYANGRSVPVAEAVGYLIGWPGMNAPGFFASLPHKRIRIFEMLHVLAKIGFGAALLLGVSPWLISGYPLFAAWAALTGLYFLLHSGSFHVLALLWQSQGRNTELLMHWPVLASTVSNYWGARWNTAFRDLAQRFIFRPMLRKGFHSARATMAVFLVSGLVHDLVISLPAGGGWGLPTLYFFIQGLAILLERSPVGKRWGLGSGVRGRAFAWAAVLAPAPLLFHSYFLYRVILPMVQDLHAMF